MRKNAFARYSKRAAARVRDLRRRAAEWGRRARHAMAAAAIVGGSVIAPHAAFGQTGQAAMAPAGGLVNRAVTSLGELDANGPGWLYYGINAADRGLGYNGSYMTLGAFVPYAQDGLGGLWALDARNHLSEYGGYFGNFGLVRKQFLGGSVLGIGVYYDYDADALQYPIYGSCGTEPFGQFGHVYNQVGVSGEWLTDFGNFRSNGYMPVGVTASTAGAPNYAFYQNFVMTQYGLDAALSGADLEVGAYVPGLSDWAGMISVGGYALGNSRYDWNKGPLTGQEVVPWFGGVYTRLDMTFLEHWDFSLQANNDSYFDWTGFARLTYRMGGSRRRNVPDQMEQPMMRNEHIVRAHTTPEVAINPSTGTPWRVIHVNNANTSSNGGAGTDADPFTTLVAANAAATSAWDVVFVRYGTGAAYDSAKGLSTTFSPLAANQYLIGNGSTFSLPTTCSGLVEIASGSGLRPILTNPSGPSINVTNGLVVNNFLIEGSKTGILGTGNLSSGIGRPGEPPYGSAVGASIVNNVAINGTQKAGQTGVALLDATGEVAFQNTIIRNMTNAGIHVEGGSANVTYNGAIRNNVATNGGFSSPAVDVIDTKGGTVSIAVGQAPAGSTIPNEVVDIGGQGIYVALNKPETSLRIDNVSLTNNKATAIAVVGSDASSTTITAGSGTGIIKTTPGAAIAVEFSESTFVYDGAIINTPSAASPPSYLLSLAGNAGGSVAIRGTMRDTGDGIQILNNNNMNADIDGATIDSRGAQGILIRDNTPGGDPTTIRLTNMSITGASGAGVLIQNTTTPVDLANLNINLSAPSAVGLQAIDSSEVTSSFNNVIITSSTIAPAVSMVNTSNIGMGFNTVSSQVPAGTNSAMVFTNSSGSFDVISAFLVSGSAGSVVADVSPTPPPVTVTVPPP